MRSLIDSSKRVQFRLEARHFAKLQEIARQLATAPGSIAKRALLRELDSDLECQLDGLRETVAGQAEALSELGIMLAGLAAKLEALNNNLRWALASLLVESGASEEVAKAHAAKLIRHLE